MAAARSCCQVQACWQTPQPGSHTCCSIAEASGGSAQACHELVPPDALAPVLRQLVDAFVTDRARPEVMTLGLKTVRELCARTPLVMTPELLQV